MGVYFKDMTMPKNCDKCIHLAWSNFYQIYVCNVGQKDEPVLFNGKQVKSTNIVRSGRAENCPLVEAPTPHGDLVDRSEIREIAISLLDKAVTDQEANAIREMWSHVVQMPVFISAEKEDL